MHKLAEKIADCLKAKIEGMGIDKINGQDLVELGMWTDIVKDMICYDKDKRIVEAMDEAEDSEEAMRYIEMYEDYPRKGYRGQPRSKTSGRFMRRGDGRRSYIPMMYEHDYDWDDMEYQRDMDRKSHNRMYYTDGNTSGSSSSGMNSGSMGSQGGSRGYSDGGRGNSESRYDRARRGYEESKAMHKGNTAEDKQNKMKSLEDYTKELASDISDMVQDMSAEEKNLLRTKLQTLAQKVQ